MFKADYSYWNSLFEALIYSSKKAPFNSNELKDSIFSACNTLRVLSECYFFGASYHDNAYCTEVVESYNYKTESLSRLYSYLIDSRAAQGGSTFSGLVSADHQWMLLMGLDGDCGSEFGITIHGSNEFCRIVSDSIAKKRTN